MVFFVFGVYRRTAVHSQDATYQHITCQRPQCPGRARLMVHQRYCHICFIPIPAPITSQDFVKCSLCGFTSTRDAHEFQLMQQTGGQQGAALVAQKVEIAPMAPTVAAIPPTAAVAASPTIAAIPPTAAVATAVVVSEEEKPMTKEDQQIV